MASQQGRLALLVDKVVDIFARENFLKIRKFLEKEPFLVGDWTFFDVEVTREASPLKVLHNLAYIPQDFVVLSQKIGFGGSIKLYPEAMGFFEPYADSRFIFLSVVGPTVAFSGTASLRSATFTTVAATPLTVNLTFAKSSLADDYFVREQDPVVFNPGPNSPGVALPPELVAGQTYYVKFDATVNGSPDSFQLSATPGGASIVSGGVAAVLPVNETLLCKPTDFRGRVRFIVGAINDL